MNKRSKLLFYIIHNTTQTQTLDTQNMKCGSNVKAQTR